MRKNISTFLITPKTTWINWGRPACLLSLAHGRVNVFPFWWEAMRDGLKAIATLS
jgi:hypothetical protein